MVLDSRRPDIDGAAEVPAAAPLEAAPARRAFANLGERMPNFVALVAATAWVALLVLTFNLEPTPDPDAALTATDMIVSMSFMYALLGAFTGFAMRRRWGLVASIGAGGVLLGAGLLCLFTGHSGMWLAAQVLGGAGMVGLSGAALKATA